MPYSDSREHTRDLLAALGPKAVEIMRQALEGRAPTVGNFGMQLATARDVLNRMDIRESDAGPEQS